MGNSESRNKHSEPVEHLEKNLNQNQWHKAVNGNTEEIQVSSPRPNVNHAAFETTSENANFTVTEELKPVPIHNMSNSHVIHENVSHPYPVNKNKSADGSDLLGGLVDKISNLLLDTEMNGGLFENDTINNKLAHITELLQETESAPQLGGDVLDNVQLNKIRELLQETESNNLVGGFNNQNLVDVNPMINKLRDLLLQETENNIINFQGGALNNENLFSENKLTESEKSEKSEHNEEEKKEHHKVHHKVKHSNDEKEKKADHTSEEANEEHENLKTDQSGGEELDTELKNILVELQTNNKHVGGKSSRKGSKKSSKKSGSKRQSRRSSEASNASNNTYNIGDSDESDVEDYLSTSSMNTSDINIKHYRS